jgi:hypothetical protein
MNTYGFTDIDECKEPHLNNCTQECINTIGSFSCECKNGFTRKDQTSCDGKLIKFKHQSSMKLFCFAGTLYKYIYLIIIICDFKIQKTTIL